jgi:hypothetical protein
MAKKIYANLLSRICRTSGRATAEITDWLLHAEDDVSFFLASIVFDCLQSSLPL